MTTLDSKIFGPLFGDAEISELLTDEAYVRTLVEVETALAKAEARLGVIPSSAAEQICSRTQRNEIDVAALAKGTARSGFPIIALVQEIRKAVGGEAASYVHWGAPTQDIMDTAGRLQLRALIGLVKTLIAEIARNLSELSNRHRVTVLAARTHGQQALPVSFGLKVATWLAPLIRHAERLHENFAPLLGGQVRGAARRRS